MKVSENWKFWYAILDIRTCGICRKNYGKIYEMDEPVYPPLPIHPNDRCCILPLPALQAGEATDNGTDGADWHLACYGELPDYYVTIADAKQNGWVPKLGNLAEVLPGKMIMGGIYENKDGHLPSTPGRVWYEADINYTEGRRGKGRVVFSNDGLIFVTYNHYETFCEIIFEEE